MKTINSSDLVKDLKFEYFETYSFQRGDEYLNEIKNIEKALFTLERRKNKKNDLNDEKEEELLFLKQTLIQNPYLINDNSKFHFSSEKTGKFENNHEKAKQIINILQKPIVNKTDWMCAPIYRDAIVFYDKKDKIMFSLNICLSCGHMHLDSNKEILPGVIIGTKKAMPVNKTFYLIPTPLKLHFLPAVSSQHITAKELKDKVAAMMKAYFVEHS